MNEIRAVILLSGGLDSATCLAMARAEGYVCHAVSFRYGQRHAVELESAKQVAAWAGVAEHIVIDIDLRQFGGSALTADIAVPKGGVGDDIPVTYVPARNLVFLSLTLAWAEAIGARDLFIGVNALDYSGYPDCRPEFIAGFEQLAELATAAGDGGARFTVHAPLQLMTKAQIAAETVRLGLDPALSWSCYDPQPDGAACGLCDSCRLRREGFAGAGLTDPLAYAA